jgi:uncharacterized protein (DUF952 family)
MAQAVYKIMTKAQWVEFEGSKTFSGASIDLVDGYIHLSTASQMRETAAKHFGGQAGLMLVALAGDNLGTALKFEPSRGGELFPHLYAPLLLGQVLWAKPLPLDDAGKHVFPETEQ